MEAVKKTLVNVTLGGQVIPFLDPIVNPSFFQVYTVKVNHAAVDARSMDSAGTEHASVNRVGTEGWSCNIWRGGGCRYHIIEMCVTRDLREGFN